MLVTAPHLRVHRPSPTTAEFTVTTSPAPGFTLRVLRLLLLLTRLLLALAAGLLLHARWAASPLAAASTLSPSSSSSSSSLLVFARSARLLLDDFARSPAGAGLRRLALALPLPLLLPAVAGLLYVLSLRVHATESLLVLRGLGVQTSERPASYLAATNTRFIPTEKIQDILINEAFRGFEVRFYLVVIVEGEEDVVVVFPGLLPRRDIVEEVWRGVRQCLYENEREDKTRAAP